MFFSNKTLILCINMQLVKREEEMLWEYMVEEEQEWVPILTEEQVFTDGEVL